MVWLRWSFEDFGRGASSIGMKTKRTNIQTLIDGSSTSPERSAANLEPAKYVKSSPSLE